MNKYTLRLSLFAQTECELPGAYHVKKVSAINQLRRLGGISLRQAKEQVDALASGDFSYEDKDRHISDRELLLTVTAEQLADFLFSYDNSLVGPDGYNPFSDEPAMYDQWDVEAVHPVDRAAQSVVVFDATRATNDQGD